MSHERFAAWQVAHQLVLEVYRLSAAWPVHERYGLVAQARRAAASAPLSLAEGAARRGSKEFRRYLDVARGSLAELGYALLLARDLGYLGDADWKAIDQLRARASALNWSLYRAVARRADSER
jgi:four helix bundle protein